MNNLTLAYPWLLALLPLPLLVWWLLPPHSEPRRALVVPFLPRLSQAAGQSATAGATVARAGLARWLVLGFCWACAVLALARPQYIEPPVTKDIPVRDLLLAVDLSGSMETKDFQAPDGSAVERLTAVKAVLDDFLAKRKGDRVGLILFGSAAFVQVPFTEDLAVCRELLAEAQVRMAGPQTAFGDALGLAINVFDRSTVKERVLIALTDGNDTNSQVPPVKAAQIAADKGIVIHTVAVGDPRAAGEDALDEAALQQVAKATGGLYSHAGSRAELQAIYDQLNQIETRKVQTVSHRPRRDVYWWPLVAALGVSFLYFGIGLSLAAWRHRRAPAPRAALADAAPAALSAGLSASAVALHLIRPEWLLALLPAALLWWRLRTQADPDRAWAGVIAPQLLDELLGGEQRKAHIGPLACLALLWLVTIVAIAGPSWRRAPQPFADDTAALAVVLRVAPSMQTQDVQPSRMERAVQKVHDLLAQRGNAKTSLIAYAGSAHRVMPATRDAGIIDNFAQALDPDIMPSAGDAAADALRLADQSLTEAGGGSILWITDSVAPEQADALAKWRRGSGTTVRLLPPLLPGAELDTLTAAVRVADAKIIRLSADDADVQAVAGAAKFAPMQGGGAATLWEESGYWLTPLIALLLLAFFRRGWLVPIAVAGR